MTTTTVAVATMKAAQIPGPGADFQILEREIRRPGPGEVRIRVQACGVCHSDVFTKEGSCPGIRYPTPWPLPSSAVWVARLKPIRSNRPH